MIYVVFQGLDAFTILVLKSVGASSEEEYQAIKELSKAMYKDLIIDCCVQLFIVVTSIIFNFLSFRKTKKYVKSNENVK